MGRCARRLPLVVSAPQWRGAIEPSEASMAQTEVINLASETRAAPKNIASNYVAISPTAELVGGGEVFLSRNRKAVAKWVSGEARPSVFVTSEVGTVQQSVPYRAVGTAIVCDVIPMAQVLNLYAENGRLGELIA